MLPVLFSIGSLNVSSYGIFLVFGFLFGVFLVWRLCRAWDFDEEKVLDFTLFTFLGGMLGARIYFVVEHLPVFASSFVNIFLINKAPGFNFWGGILGGWLTLFILARRSKIDFLQLADIAAVGLLGGLILADFGCFFGGCNIGIQGKGIFAVTMIGAAGKRWPVQLIEALLLILALIRLWSLATHFHQRGKIISLAFIFVGAIKLVLDPLKQDHSQGVFPVVLILLGFTVFYRVTKQNPVSQLSNFYKFVIVFFINPETRKLAIQNLGKSWYNQKTAFGWKIRNLKKLLKRSNVKLS